MENNDYEKAFLECMPYNDEYYKVSFLIYKAHGNAFVNGNSGIEGIKFIDTNRFYEILELSCKLREIITDYDEIQEDDYEWNINQRLIDEEVTKINHEHDAKIKRMKDEHVKKLKEYEEEADEYEKEIEDHKKKLDEMRREHEKRMVILEKEKDTLKYDKNNLLIAIKEKEESMNIFKNQMEQYVTKFIEPMKKTHKEEITRLETQHKEEKVRMEKQNNDEKNRMESTKQTEILRLESSYKSLIEVIEKNSQMENLGLKKKIEESENKIQELYDELKCSQASVVKGSVGQSDFQELVKRYTDWTNVEDTSKTARAGDLRGFIGKTEVLFEVKNYTTDVPGKEVTKFIRDMEVHSNIPYGVFISMNSNIANKKGTITFQWTTHGQLCIFFSNFLKNDVEMGLKYIGECASIGQRFYSLNKNEDENKVEMYKDKIMQIKLIITKQLSDVSEMMASMLQHKKLQLDNITKHYTEYKLCLDKMKLSCNEIIDIIIGDSNECEVVEEVNEETVQENDVKKRSKKKKTKESD